MENITNRNFLQDRKLKRLFITYVVVSAIFLAVILFCIVMRKYAGSLDETLKGLLSFKSNINRIENATVDMKRSLETINATISPDYFSNSSEKQLLMGLDTLKTSMRNDTITVAEFSYTDAEVTLPVTIRGAMSSYASLVGDVGKLQSLKFPFFSIKGITIKKGETIQIVRAGNEIGEKQATVYEISGELRLPRNSGSGPTKENEGAGNPSGARNGVR
jgi:hypothetical protein